MAAIGAKRGQTLEAEVEAETRTLMPRSRPNLKRPNITGMYIVLCGSLMYREVGVAKHIEYAVVIDEKGNAVMVSKETTGVVVENEEGRAVAVQTAVRGVVLGNVLNQREPTRAIESAPPTITEPAHDDDDDEEDGICSCCSCWCVVKWTLLTICCLPFLPLICIYYCCCKE